MGEDARVQHALASLYDFRTRALGKRRLVRAGEAALPAVAAEMDDPRSGPIRWVLLNLVGEIGSRKGLRHVEPYVSHPELGQVARDAARTIRVACGDPDEDVSVAPVAVALDSGGVNSGPAKPLFDLLQTALSGERCVFMSLERGGWDVLVHLIGGRVQHVKVVEGKTGDGMPVVTVYTECGPARKGAYEWALRNNFTFGFGGFALREVRGELLFCACAGLPRAGLDARLLGLVVRLFAERGDFLEKRLTGADAK